MVHSSAFNHWLGDDLDIFEECRPVILQNVLGLDLSRSKLVLLAEISQGDAVSFSMHYIRRYMMLVYPVAGDVTLDDLIRVVFLSGSFNFSGYC